MCATEIGDAQATPNCSRFNPGLRSGVLVTLLVILGWTVFEYCFPAGRYIDIGGALAIGDTQKALAEFQRLRSSDRRTDRRQAYEQMGVGLMGAARAGRRFTIADAKAWFGTPDSTSGYVGIATDYGYAYDRDGNRDGMLWLKFDAAGVFVQAAFGQAVFVHELPATQP